MCELKVIHNKGNIVIKGEGKRKFYLDQLYPTEKWVHLFQMRKYLKAWYGLTLEEYYCLVVYGDKDFRPTCPIEGCDKILQFWNLSLGFKKTCCNNHAHLLQWQNEEYQSRMSKMCGEVIQGTHPLTARNMFVNRYKDKLDCNFYLGITEDNKIKIGITSGDIYERFGASWRFDSHLRSIHQIYCSSAINVADLEMLIKHNFNQISEYFEFDKLHEIINIIKEFRTNHN